MISSWDTLPSSKSTSLIKSNLCKKIHFRNASESKSEISFIHNTDRIHSSTFRTVSFVTFHVSEFPDN